MMKSLLTTLAALLVLAGGAQVASAQVITDGNLERGLRWPWTPSFDGEPYTQRYSYGMGGIFYLNGNPGNLYYLDYLDKADRARKFGYRMPPDPFGEVVEEGAEPVVVHPAPAQPTRVFLGGGLGFWRRR